MSYPAEHFKDSIKKKKQQHNLSSGCGGAWNVLLRKQLSKFMEHLMSLKRLRTHSPCWRGTSWAFAPWSDVASRKWVFFGHCNRFHFCLRWQNNFFSAFRGRFRHNIFIQHRIRVFRDPIPASPLKKCLHCVAVCFEKKSFRGHLCLGLKMRDAIVLLCYCHLLTLTVLSSWTLCNLLWHLILWPDGRKNARARGRIQSHSLWRRPSGKFCNSMYWGCPLCAWQRCMHRQISKE